MPSGSFIGFTYHFIYTSELILCSTICVHSATRHNIHMYPHLNSGVKLLLESYRVVVIKLVAFFTIWVKLTMPFTCTSFPLNLYTSVFGGGCGFRFKQKFWQIDGFGRKGTDRQICIPLFTPLQETISSSNMMQLLQQQL